MTKEYFDSLAEKLKKVQFSLFDRTGYSLISPKDKPVEVLPKENGVDIIFDEFIGDIVNFRIGKGMKIKIEDPDDKTHS